MSRLEELRTFRERMNERLLERDNLEIRRFFALDVGGSITIPHLRRAAALVDELNE